MIWFRSFRDCYIDQALIIDVTAGQSVVVYSETTSIESPLGHVLYQAF